MRKWLIMLVAAPLAGWVPALLAVTISGNVTVGGAFPNVQMLAPKATCTLTDALGKYKCDVASGWSGTLAPYSNGWTFVVTGNAQEPAAATFTSLGADQSGVNFEETMRHRSITRSAA